MSAGHIAVFMEELAEQVSSPDTVKHYINGIKQQLKRMHCPIQQFESCIVQDAIESMSSTVRHFPTPSQPISPRTLEDVIAGICHKEAPTICCFVLLSFTAIVRQSTISPRVKSGFDNSRHLCRDDIYIEQGRIWVRFKWAKNGQSALDSQDDKILPVISGSILCPTRAVMAMLAFCPTKSPKQPLISFRDGSPVPISLVNRIWKETTTRLGLIGRAYTMHCLRKGGGKVIQDMTNDDTCVQVYGGWRSKKGLRAYIKDKANIKANDAFAKLAK